MSQKVKAQVKVSEDFFGVYLLYCLNPKYKGRTYIGYTRNQDRRLLEHVRGNWVEENSQDSKMGPWKMVLIVHGFPNNISALRFEWAWQNPSDSIRKHDIVVDSEFQIKLRILAEMLRVDPWNQLPLLVRWLEKEFYEDIPMRTFVKNILSCEENSHSLIEPSVIDTVSDNDELGDAQTSHESEFSSLLCQSDNIAHVEVSIEDSTALRQDDHTRFTYSCNESFKDIQVKKAHDDDNIVVKDHIPLLMDKTKDLVSIVHTKEDLEQSNNPTTQVHTKEDLEQSTNPTTQESSSGVKRKKTYLCGAARKRFHHWLSRGFSKEEALELCHKPFSECTFYQPHARVSPNRQKPGTCEPPRKEQTSEQKNPDNVEAEAPLLESFLDSDNPFKLGIMEEHRSITVSEAELVKQHLLQRIDSTPGKGPKFRGCVYKAGCLVVTCLNRETGDWLKIQVEILKPWEGASLKIVEDLPKPVLAVAFVQNSTIDAKTLIRRLEKQNPGLGCGSWRVVNVKRQSEGQTVCFSFDQSSLVALQKAHNAVCLDFGMIHLRIKGKKPKHTSSGSSHAATISVPFDKSGDITEAASFASQAETVLKMGGQGDQQPCHSSEASFQLFPEDCIAGPHPSSSRAEARKFSHVVNTPSSVARGYSASKHRKLARQRVHNCGKPFQKLMSNR